MGPSSKPLFASIFSTRPKVVKVIQVSTPVIMQKNPSNPAILLKFTNKNPLVKNRKLPAPGAHYYILQGLKSKLFQYFAMVLKAEWLGRIQKRGIFFRLSYLCTPNVENQPVLLFTFLSKIEN